MSYCGLYDEIMEAAEDREFRKEENKKFKKIILAACELEELAQAIRKEDFETFKKLTYEFDGCHERELGVEVDLMEIYNILEINSNGK